MSKSLPMTSTRQTPELAALLAELTALAPLQGRSAMLAAAFLVLAEAKVVWVTRVEGVDETQDGEVQCFGPSREFRALMVAVRGGAQASDMMRAAVPARPQGGRVRKTIPDRVAGFFAAFKGSGA